MNRTRTKPIIGWPTGTYETFLRGCSQAYVLHKRLFPSNKSGPVIHYEMRL